MFTVIDTTKISGNIWFVHSGTGTDGDGYGQNPDAPFLTLDYAVGKCTANNGDHIFLMPGHAEDVIAAGTITCDVAGVTIIGLGTGADRPTLTFKTDNGASVLITAASVKIRNIVGVAGKDGLTNPFHVQAADCELDIEWQDGSATVEAVRAVLTTAAADRLKLNLKYRGFTGGDACVNGVRLVGCDGGAIVIDAYGLASTAWLEFHATACTNITVRGYVYNHGTTDLSKTVVDTATGSTWFADGYDGAAGCSFSGGSGGALQKDDVGALAAIIGTITNTGGTATVGGVLGDVANSSMATRLTAIKAEVDKIGTITNTGGTASLGGVLGDVANNSVASRLTAIKTEVDKIGTITNTGGTATLGGVLGDVANVSVATNLAKIGTLTNTGGTATLGEILGDVANSSIAARLITLAAELSGAAGIAAFPAAAAPANDVSLAEVIRAIYDRQLGDGTNSGTNSRLGKKVTRGAADIFDGTLKPLFTVSGGRVLLTHLEVEVTTLAIDAGASNMKFVSDPTVGTDMDLCAVLDINADELGTIYSISGVVTDAVTGGTGGGAMAMQRPIVVPEGAVAINTVADVGTGGALGKCELWYIPLDDGASVAAA
jgi:hypothetical protein